MLYLFSYVFLLSLNLARSTQGDVHRSLNKSFGHFVSRFMEENDDISKPRKYLVGLWSLDDSMYHVIVSCESFVLSPRIKGRCLAQLLHGS